MLNYYSKATKRLLALRNLQSTWNRPDSCHCSTSSQYTRADSREHRTARLLGGDRREKGEEKSEVAVWLAGDAGTGSVFLSFSRFGAFRMYVRTTNATSTMVLERLISLVIGEVNPLRTAWFRRSVVCWLLIIYCTFLKWKENIDRIRPHMYEMYTCMWTKTQL